MHNEEAVIKRLKQVYNKSLSDIEEKTKALQDDINRLGALADLAADDEEKAKILSQQQSKIYQKQYQDAMKKQIGSVLDQMQVEEFKTVSDYLNKCYEEGFVGTMYDLQGQGIPLCFPMDQEAIVRAVQIDSKISQGLYSRLGEDVSMLKKKITAEVSRGISTGMSYQQIAQQLAGVSKIGFNNAVRIARTEGHRIATQSAMDACYKAKDKGADIVKQWDATLDSSTRESHSQVDMEIRELDKPFSNGLMYPGDPSGGAAEVVNCRCALDQRARWALEGEFTKRDGFTGELKTFESQEAYDEYKKAYFSKENKQYMKYVEEMQDKYNSGNFEKVMAQMTDAEYKHFTKLQAARPTFEGMYRNQPYVKKIRATKYDDFKKEYKATAEEIKIQESKPKFVPVKTREEAEQYADRFVSQYKSKYSGNVSYKGIDVEYANKVNKVLTDVSEKYNFESFKNIEPMNFRKSEWKNSTADAAYRWGDGGVLYLNPHYFSSKKAFNSHMDEADELLKTVINGADKLLANPKLRDVQREYIETLVRTGRQVVAQSVDDFAEATFIHEMGHALDDKIFNLQSTKSGFDIKKSMEKYSGNISGYAISNSREYVAESFAAHWYVMDNILDPDLVDIFKKYENTQTVKKISSKILENSESSSIIKVDIQLFANKNILKQKDSELLKSIESWKKNIEEHTEWISNPPSHDKLWDSKNDMQRNGLIRHWEKEIKTFKKDIAEAEAELAKRGKKP